MKLGLRKTLILVFCIGILFCGIGTGIALIEYSSFEYLGQKDLNAKDLKTETFTEKLDRGEKGDKNISVWCYDLEEEQIALETSKKVSKEEIQFVVEYNENVVRNIHIASANPTVYYNEMTGEYEYGEGPVEYYVTSIIDRNNAIDQFLRHKDEILENIKQKKFYKYENATIASVKVIVNPSNKNIIELGNY